MKKLHYFSGITISIFIGLHLFNHFMSVFGAPIHIEVMDKLRVIYRDPIAEIILLSAIAIQIFTGIKLFFSKRKTAIEFFEKLQIWSGLYLAFFFLIHVSAVLGGRYVMELDTNLYFGAAGLNTFPFNLFFIPYYGFSIISFFGHLAAIHFQKMNRTIFGISLEQQSRFILMLGVFATLVIFYGLTDGFTGLEIPEPYNVLIGK